jgi:hypothetical protein
MSGASTLAARANTLAAAKAVDAALNWGRIPFMGLNIKNPDVHDMAARLARRLDTSMTQAIAIALKEKLAATEEDALVEQRFARLMDLSDAMARRLTPRQRSMDIDAELYDAQGLPK